LGGVEGAEKGAVEGETAFIQHWKLDLGQVLVKLFRQQYLESLILCDKIARQAFCPPPEKDIPAAILLAVRAKCFQAHTAHGHFRQQSS